MCKILFISVFTFVSFGLSAQANRDSVDIIHVMKMQESAWNNGNIEGFMDGYWQSDSLVFVGKRGPSYGWAKVLANYKSSYPDKKAMGKLQFDQLRLTRLSSQAYMVIGSWKLSETAKESGGWFSLVFKKTRKGWKIIADHTSG
jgi:ketosteroid isomerase-like protein